MPKNQKHLDLTSRAQKYAASKRDQDKVKGSAIIAQKTEAFLAAGGKVTQIGMGVSGDQFLSPMARAAIHRQEQRRKHAAPRKSKAEKDQTKVDKAERRKARGYRP